MKILVADDDAFSRRLLELALAEWGFQVIAASNGEEALEALQGPDAPKLAILDWVMPGMDGVEVCQKLRASPTPEPTYILLLTGRGDKEDVVQGLKGGANDYVTKPFDQGELQARVQVGRNVVELQQQLAARVRELEKALAQVKQLCGLLPICCYCKKIRDDKYYWHRVEAYISEHSDAQFTHGICPECYERVVKEMNALGQPS